MGRCRRHIALLLAAVLFVSVSCRRDEAEVIPRAKLSKIYAEMLVTDQWITATPGVRMIADTSLVYEPILEKYGYDSDDYRKSVDHYMNDPERFSRILRTSSELLDKRINQLKQEQKRVEALAKLPKIKSDFRPGDYVPYLTDEPYVHYYDSLAVVVDTAMMYRLISLERADTVYDRIRMIIVDSLYINDSIPCLDSILKSDSLLTLLGADSLRSLRIDTTKVAVDTAAVSAVDIVKVNAVKLDTALLRRNTDRVKIAADKPMSASDTMKTVISPVRKAKIVKKD